MKVSSIFTVLVMVLLISSSILAGDRPLMKYPDIHENTIVFTHARDIWKVSADGGVATRLTINDGAERYPKFSPDGKLIAFTGEYDGNNDVYVMDVHGGNITRLTFHPGFDQVIGWHPTKNKIIFQSSRNSYSRYYRLFMISPDGSGLEDVGIHEIAGGSFSPDGSKIAFNKVSREFRTWKRYKGGTAQDIYIYDFKTAKTRKITRFNGTDRLPMWAGNKIYFTSDRDRVLNVYVYDMNTEKIEQITRHTEYDARFPSLGGNKIIYELAGQLWVLDLTTQQNKQIPVEIKADAEETRPYFKNVKEFITHYELSPCGKTALISARGEVFTVPSKEGRIKDLTNTSGARDKDAVWSPDGKTIAWFSDQAGEYNLYIGDPQGMKKAIKLTSHKKGYRHTLKWSPDSKMIAYTDETLTLYYIDVQSKKITNVDKAEYENVDVSLDVKPIYDFSWSPDGAYIAYSKMDANLLYQNFIYSLKTGKTVLVSDGLFNDFNPVFSADGRHLIFISNRQFNPTFGDFEWEMVYKNMAGIYALTLQKNGQSIFDDEKKETKETVSRIDFDGLQERIEAFPLTNGNYRNLLVAKDMVLYLNKEQGDFNRFEFRARGPMDLFSFCLKGKKENKVLSGIDGFKVSADGSSLIYKKGNDVGILDAGAVESPGQNLDLTELTMWLEPLKEWKQIYNEAWRNERDFYYEPNMHGIDWDAMKVKYEKLLDNASCRQDLQYIIGELIGELNTGHTYVYGGDIKRNAEQVNVGMLGVDIEIKNNVFQIKKIYNVPDWSNSIVPPLAGPGKDVSEGDYILAVDGKDMTADQNFYSYFQGLSHKEVTLLINNKPTKTGAHELKAKTLNGERTLRYLDWVEHNRKVVDTASNGQIGYIHFPDTYLGSAVEFPKYFYSQTQKKGIILDGRFNAGGLSPDIFLNRFDRKIYSFWTRRHSHDQAVPFFAPMAHLVCLTNRQAGSGGDELPFDFQEREMGPVIGTRTWGGLVGVSHFFSMVDGGGLTAPDYRIYDREGKWVVENVGVTPDIEIDLDPAEMAKGWDAQLQKGIEVLIKKINEEPIKWPEHGPYPVDK